MDQLFIILKHFMGLAHYGANSKIIGLTSRGRTHYGVKPLAGGLFISNLSKMLKFSTTHRKMTTKSNEKNNFCHPVTLEWFSKVS